MKKLVFSVLIALCVFLSLFPTVYAFAGDSLNVTEQERSDYQVSNDEILIKVYYDRFVYSFADGKDISEIIDSAELHYYSGQNIASSWWRLIIGDDGAVYPRYTASGDLEKMLRYAKQPELVFPNWVSVESAYILMGSDIEGYAVYFETSIGDYVLNKGYYDPNTYLFPAKDFKKCSEKYVQYLDNRTEIEIGGYSMMDVCDIDAYRFTGPDTAFQGIIRTAGIVLSVAGWALAVLFFLKWRKTKKQSTSTPDSDTPAT